MKCKNCGAEIPNNAKFCEYCGTSITPQMQKEQEQLNKAGCPKCGSTNISFDREKQGEVKGKGNMKIVRATVGVCKDCGYTWQPEDNDSASPKRKTWLWVLGWIFIFPVPLTILLLRKKDMKPALKYGLIAAAWIVYILIAAIGGSQNDTSSSGTGIQKTNDIGQTQAAMATNADGKQLIYPGEILNDGDLQIEFISAEDFTEYEDWEAPDEGKKVIKLNLKCKNVSDIDKMISFFDFECFADNEAADRYLFGDDDLSATISPGREASGALYYEVPENAESIEVEYEVNVWKDEKAIFVVK